MSSFFARIQPEPDGGWTVYLSNGSDHAWTRDGFIALTTVYQVDVLAHARTEARARRKATKMLAKIRKAHSHLSRRGIVVNQ